MKRIVVAVTGATGSVYAQTLLRELKGKDGVETHLVMSPAGILTLRSELGIDADDFGALADVVHAARNIGASIASGSFPVDAMIVAPCSMRTLGAIAHGLGDNLITRAADVTLKERRRLVLLAREAPLNLAHLRNMTAVTEMGGIVFPPVPAFYAGIETLERMIAHTVGRVLELVGIESSTLHRWPGLGRE